MREHVKEERGEGIRCGVCRLSIDDPEWKRGCRPWVIRPDDEQDAGGHIWFDFDGLECCKRCAVVKRRDGKNKPCRGTTGGIGLRGAGAVRVETRAAACDVFDWTAERVGAAVETSIFTGKASLSSVKVEGVCAMCPFCGRVGVRVETAGKVAHVHRVERLPGKDAAEWPFDACLERGEVRE